MGNGSSQSMVIGHHSRSLGNSSSSSSALYQNRYQRPPKYAHPHNRVLPNPVAGQRLRSTDNGHILHSAGTIRGLKPGSPMPQDMEDGDPEVMDILKKRSEIIEKEQENCSQINLRNQRMFYSDPDISRSKQTSNYSPEVCENGCPNRRISGGAAAKANKLKQKKKARAPDPPPLGDNYHGHFQRRAQSSSDLTASKQQEGNSIGGDCRCVIPEWKPKSRAPPPPPAPAPTPPEPPPMPSMTYTSQNRQQVHKESTSLERYRSSVKTADTRSAINSVSPQRIEVGRSVPDRLHNRHREESDNRTTIFNSKADLLTVQNKRPSLVPHQPDPFQKEIEEVTKKIAQTRQINAWEVTDDKAPPVQKDVGKVAPPKQYYFSDKDVCKTEKKIPKVDPDQQHNGRDNPTGLPVHNGIKSDKSLGSSKPPSAIAKLNEDLHFDRDAPLRRFSPIRGRSKDSGHASLEEEDRRMGNGDTHIETLPNDEKSDIDLRLRPVLPRKTPQLPKFSAMEAWQALGSDGQGSSNQSTSDESIQRYLLHANRMYSKKESERFYDHVDSKTGSRSSYNCTPSDCQWTPRQDLNDSDTSSLASEEVVVPRHRVSEFPTRFSLPTIMFSNIRPIGADMTSGGRNKGTSYYDRDEMYTSPRKKSGKYDSSQRFKRFLGIRNKYLSEEDISFSDSNWTFGGHGLHHHKRAKQYSSELMLSDKRKYELMTRNNYGGFGGDVKPPKPKVANDSFMFGDPGNPSFSFYSTDGHVMYLPQTEHGGKMYPNSKGRNNQSRRKVSKTDQSDQLPKNFKKSSSGYDVELEMARSHDVAMMLEDEVRRKRNKEKIAIRQQLRMIKQLDSDGEDSEDEVDEAYFTEPKSLEGSSPLHHLPPSDLPFRGERSKHDRKWRGDGAHASALMHWKSSPALLDEQSTKPYGLNSCSSPNSSPDPVAWQQSGPTEKWPPRKQQSHVRRIIGKHRRVSEGDSSPVGRRCSVEDDTPSPTEPKMTSAQAKDKKATTSIYKQLMDIVRREERYLKKAEGREFDHGSRESSYSQRESSHSSSSHDSVSSSSNSYSDCSGPAAPDESGKSGMPANNEFHSAAGREELEAQARQSSSSRPPGFHAAFVQPYSPNKSYRPVHFEVKATPNTCRVPILQENLKAQAEVS